MTIVNIPIQICKEGTQLPIYKNPNDSGMDIRATEDVVIKPNETKIIPTGIKVAIPEGYEIQVRPRSGVSSKTPLRVSNAPGTIDVGFRDEIGVIITNISPNDSLSQLEDFMSVFLPTNFYTLDDEDNKQGTYLIRKGDRIAQIVLQEVPRINWVQVDDVSTIGDNRNGGFGSTGTV